MSAFTVATYAAVISIERPLTPTSQFEDLGVLEELPARRSITSISISGNVHRPVLRLRRAGIEDASRQYAWLETS